MVSLDLGDRAQMSVIGAMLRDSRCVPLVLSKLTPDDFMDGTCRSTFTAIRRLVREGRPVDELTVVDAMQGGDRYMRWVAEILDMTVTAANVGEYIPMVRRAARRRTILELAEKLPDADDDEMDALVRRMCSALSDTERMPMMTGPERVADFFARMRSQESPQYLPWGIPTADRCVYAELGDMILLGGYASAGKTLLSIRMAETQARAGYKVGYYSLETSPQKMTDRQLSSLADVPLRKIKEKNFSEREWRRFAEAGNSAASDGSFDIVDASCSSADDITAHAIGHGYQIIYVDYVQNLLVPGMRGTENYARVTAISQTLKNFSRSTKTAVVALAQLSRPPKENGRPVPPSMHSFKESGQLEQDADAAFLLYPSDPNDNNSNRIFKIGKNKEGPRATAELSFHGATQTMVELETEPDHTDSQMNFYELPGDDKDNPFAKK